MRRGFRPVLWNILGLEVGSMPLIGAGVGAVAAFRRWDG